MSDNLVFYLVYSLWLTCKLQKQSSKHWQVSIKFIYADIYNPAVCLLTWFTLSKYFKVASTLFFTVDRYSKYTCRCFVFKSFRTMSYVFFIYNFIYNIYLLYYKRLNAFKLFFWILFLLIIYSHCNLNLYKLIKLVFIIKKIF